MQLYKIIILLALVFMVYNLFRAMLIMNKPSEDKPPMSKYIGRRVLVSGLIIIGLLLAIVFGVITPNPRPY